MTIKGTVDKTAICLILLLIPAYYVFTTGFVGYAIPGAIIGFILAMVTIFKRKWAQYTVPCILCCTRFFLRWEFLTIIINPTRGSFYNLFP